MSKLLIIVFVSVCALVAQVMGGCNPIKRLKVKDQWAQAVGFAEKREEFNTLVWTEIIDRFPETVERYFGNVRGDNIYSPEFRAHMARVFSGFDMSLSLLSDQPVLDAQLAHLKTQHIDLDVDAKYFDGFAKALMHAVQHRLGMCFDYDAWKACLKVIEDGIKHD